MVLPSVKVMISHGGHGMVYGMAWSGMAWYTVWPGGHGMVYDKVWRGMAWYVEMLMWISCFMALPWAMVPLTCGEADVSFRSCSVPMHSSCSLWAVKVNWEIVNIYIPLFLVRIFDSHSYCVLSTDQAFCESFDLFYSNILLSYCNIYTESFLFAREMPKMTWAT